MPSGAAYQQPTAFEDFLRQPDKHQQLEENLHQHLRNDDTKLPKQRHNLGQQHPRIDKGIFEQDSQLEQPSKLLVCTYCQATFLSVNGLRGHINKVHLNVTPFVCTLCGKGFNFKRHYEGHMNTHFKIKAFPCQEPGCSAEFTYNASLNRHMRDKHGVKK